jgi:hypothetical protein
MNKRLVKKIVFLLMAALTLFMVAVTHVAAQEIPFYWDNINVTIDLQANGDMLVTETQKICVYRKLQQSTVSLYPFR